MRQVGEEGDSRHRIDDSSRQTAVSSATRFRTEKSSRMIHRRNEISRHSERERRRHKRIKGGGTGGELAYSQTGLHNMY